MSKFKRLRLAGLGLAAAALLAAGCDTTVYLNTEQLEQEIMAEFQSQTGLALTLSCPDDRPIQQGDVFTCTGEGSDGNTYTIQVTQTDAAGNVSWTTV
jgi:hypothetical protein